MSPSADSHGGFWIRLSAVCFDFSLVSALIIGAARFCRTLGWYLPIELTVLLATPIYFIVSEVYCGQTIGKWLCGLVVTRTDGASPDICRLVLRETIGKLGSLLPFGMGFLWCGFTRKKRTWHDYFANTRVVRSPSPLGRRGQIAVAVFVIGVFAVALDVPGWVSICCDAVSIKSSMPIKWAFEQRDPKTLTEVSALRPLQHEANAAWLRANTTNPVDYAVVRALEHQVLVFGEGAHEKKEYLDLLNEMIPQLNKRAGVTCVAMEVCLAEDNERIRQLVTAPEFNREWALEIARHQPWGIWGFKEYWDVFETVWRLNRTIPAGQRKVRVIGLDSPMDMQSVGMTIGEGENPSKQCPVWEKLRVMRLLRALPKVLARDVRMAAQMKREVLDTGEHAVVWVGGEHARACPQPVFNGYLVSRMGALLRQRYGDKVFFIRLHGFDIPASLVDRNYHGSDPAMASTMEALMKTATCGGVAFDIAGSPLALLRDTASFDYYFDPRLALGDITDGYVYLKPWRQLTECAWTPNYITPTMFTANKPFYEAFGKKAKRPVHDAAGANAVFQEP